MCGTATIVMQQTTDIPHPLPFPSRQRLLSSKCCIVVDQGQAAAQRSSSSSRQQRLKLNKKMHKIYAYEINKLINVFVVHTYITHKHIHMPIYHVCVCVYIRQVHWAFNFNACAALSAARCHPRAPALPTAL